VNSEDRIINKLVEMKAYLHEKVATKEELNVAKTEIMTHIDGFAKRQEKFDHELVSTRLRMDRIGGEV